MAQKNVAFRLCLCTDDFVLFILFAGVSSSFHMRGANWSLKLKLAVLLSLIWAADSAITFLQTGQRGAAVPFFLGLLPPALLWYSARLGRWAGLVVAAYEAGVSPLIFIFIMISSLDPLGVKIRFMGVTFRTLEGLGEIFLYYALRFFLFAGVALLLLEDILQQRRAESGTPPNGGPAAPSDSSRMSEGPPSVS
jgi:hypothetical protein